jgi:DNA-binding transcriptional LysR family regulator
VLDVRRLRVLREVARRGSIAAAADALSFTSSAVSQQIAVLERETGVVLLERRARGVVLTEAGETLVGHVDTILGEIEHAESALRRLADLRQGRLRLACFATAGATVLPWAVRAFRARHPQVELSVSQASPAEGVALVRAGAADLALVVDAEDGPEGVDVVHLFDDPLRLALHRDHPLAGAPAIALGQLAAETWIDVPSRSSGGKVLQRACAAAGFTPRIEYESDDYSAIRELVGVGAGLALLPDLARFGPHETVVLRSLEMAGADAPRRRIQAATRSAPFRSPAASAMLELLLGPGPWRPEGAQPAVAMPPSR